MSWHSLYVSRIRIFKAATPTNPTGGIVISAVTAGTIKHLAHVIAVTAAALGAYAASGGHFEIAFYSGAAAVVATNIADAF